MILLEQLYLRHLFRFDVLEDVSMAQLVKMDYLRVQTCFLADIVERMKLVDEPTREKASRSESIESVKSINRSN